MSQLMCMLYHKWMKWSDCVPLLDRGTDAIVGYVQWRQCTRCGKRISRTAY